MRAKKLREPFVFFIDECLGCTAIKEVLAAACLDGESIKLLPQGTLDEDWLPQGRPRGVGLFLERSPDDAPAQ